MKKFLLALLMGLAVTVPAFADNAYIQTRLVFDGNERKLVKYAFANIASGTTDGALVAAVASKRIKVLYYAAGAAGTATDFTFTTKPGGAGTAISPTLRAAAGAWQFAFCPVGCFQTASGEGLSVTTSVSAVNTGIAVAYIEAEP